MLGGVHQVFLGAQDVRDSHEVIVDDDGEVVGREVVGLADDDVVVLRGGDGDIAEDEVVDDDVFARHVKTEHGGDAGLSSEDAAGHVATVAEGAFFFFRGLAHGGELGGGFVSFVRAVLGNKLVQIFLIEREALGLEELIFGPPYRGAFVPVEAEPEEVIEDAGGGFGGGADLVGVLNAQDKLAADGAVDLGFVGVEPGVEGGACAADVEEAGGGWGEASDDHGGAPVNESRIKREVSANGKRPRVRGGNAASGGFVEGSGVSGCVRRGWRRLRIVG